LIYSPDYEKPKGYQCQVHGSDEDPLIQVALWNWPREVSRNGFNDADRGGLNTYIFFLGRYKGQIAYNHKSQGIYPITATSGGERVRDQILSAG